MTMAQATTAQFLSQLRQLGVRVWADGDQLRYQAAKGVMTAVLLDELRQRKTDILALIQQAEQGIATPSLIIQAAPRHEPIPLSWAQQRLWFLEQLHGTSAAYNIAGAFVLDGRLDHHALQQSLNEIVRRHESLRTTFSSDPIQTIQPPAPLPLPCYDLRHLPEAERLVEARRLANEEASQPFDITADLLIRAQLLQTANADGRADTQHILLLTCHHLITDGQSIEIFNTELAALYAAFVAGKPSPLPELSHQYADFAVSQREWLASEALAGQLAYWQKQLADAPDLLPLPLDYPRRPVQTFNGGVETAVLSANLVQKLRQLAQTEGTTLYMVMQAALSAFLGRYGRQNDILTGLSVANRHHTDIADLIGFFVNTLVIRADLAGKPTFRHLLQQVRRTVLDGFAHQDVPFEKLVAVLRPERDMSYTPLVQVMVSWLDGERGLPQLPNLTIRPLATDFVPARFDLSLEVYETSRELKLMWLYNSDLFAAETMARWRANFAVFVEAIAANPNEFVHHLPLLTEVEQQQLAAWNETERPYPDLLLHQLFETQVEHTPEKTAVTFGDQSLSYAQLNQRANQLAHYLQSQGVGPEVMVGVCMERSLEMVIALYAILKAGGAYVPIDPTYPPERLRFMLEDSEVPLLLTQSYLLARLPQTAVHLVPLHNVDKWLADYPITNPSNKMTSENLAYMIYTSGSTGQPKGTMNSHRGIVNRLLWMQEAYALEADDCVLQKTPFGFDVSVWEFFWPLLAGARLVVAKPEGHKDTAYLIDIIKRERVTTIHFVPSMLQAFLSDARVKECTAIRRVMCSGEALTYDLQQRFFQHLAAELHNLYGPTEAAVDVTYWRCRSDDARKIVPIGRPVANTQIYIVDEHNRPVPIGVPGELLIGGVQVARGYWRREELTDLRFTIDDLQSNRQSSIVNRRYKTGDLCRWLPDGTIVYLGRLDHQVKLRGFRIELGEIEAVLAGHTAVREALVLLRDDLPGGSQLVAYVTADEGLNTEDLRPILQQKLPDYMIPTYLVRLDAFPLSPNGKIDRRQLPPPIIAPPTRDSHSRSPIEASLVAIWTELLQRETVGVTDNFFDLGGHSLLATQVVSRLGAIYGRSIPVRALFEAPTIAELSRVVERVLGEGRPSLPAVTPVPRTTLLPLSYAQQRLWILSQMAGQEATYNIAIALHIRGALDIPALQHSLNLLVQRHETLRTGFVMANGRPTQQIHPAIAIALPVMEVQVGQVADLAAAEGKRPFNLSEPPLIRLTLLQLAEDEFILLLTMHHIISDGWSLSIFVRELALLYQDAATLLPPLAIQYADYAHWQHQHLTDEALAPQIEYWRKQLAGLPPLLNLPTDRPRPAMQTANGRIHYFSFSPELTTALKQCARQHNVTLFMMLLAGFATLLARYTNQDNIPLGSGIANRTRAEIESLIGFFVNTLVMRVDTSDNPTFAELLAKVRQMTLAAYAHQDVPFERLVEILQPERDLSHAPLFQVIFTLQNVPLSEAHLPDLDITPWHITDSTAKVDLTVLMTETASGSSHTLTGTLEYNTDLFDAATIERLIEHFQILLQDAVIRTEEPILTLNLLTETEKAQLMTWNETEAAYPVEATIVSLFGEMVAKFGGKTAVIANDTSLTYSQLHQQAQHIAAHLIEHGVQPGDRIGLLLSRNHQMISAILGVLYAGGIYVSLDPEYPAERLQHMVRDSGCQVVIYDLRFTIYDWVTGSEVLQLEINDLLRQPPLTIDNLPLTIDPSSPAYLLYTSGSTGKPKGVLVTHRNVVRLLKNDQHPFDFDEQDVWVVAHSFCFDFSVWEMYGALLNGGTVVVVEREVVRDTAIFLTLLQQHRITILNQTPAAFYNLLAYEQTTGTPQLQHHLRCVIFGGDRLEPTYLRGWVGRYPLDHIRLVNMYGITETTVHVTHYTLTEQDVWGEGGRSPIGVPMPETQVYILNEARQMQPIGIPGEIYVGGSGVSAGYWGQPDLTDLRFKIDDLRLGSLENRQSSIVNRQLYKSGDLGRWLADGTLEHLGRNDFQVQLRGFRIELGEIEQVLLAETAVSQAVVIARGETEDKHLIAYVIPDEKEAPLILRYAQMKQKGELDGRSLTDLPHGQTIVHLNQSETAFIYEEIFQHNSYLQHGISIKEGDTIVDIGANIGMFSLFAAQQAENVTVYAFEPLPAAYDCLCLNGRLHNLNLKSFQQGISDQTGTTTFHYYPHVSILSGQFAGTEEERETVRAFLQQQSETEFIEELLDERLQHETITADLTTLCHIIQQEKIEKIDLLKIDVEKGERAVLNGISKADWHKIQQIVIEVHDIDGTLQWVTELLASKGFATAVSQDQTLTNTNLYNLYATRTPTSISKAPPRSPAAPLHFRSPTQLINTLRQAIQAALPEYMMPSAFVLLGQFPLTRNGKIDRAALPEPEQRQGQGELVLPRTEAETKLASIWQEVLKIPQVGIHDDFFALGGHSLLATQLIARIPAVFGIELPLSAIFEGPTIVELSERIETIQWAAGMITDTAVSHEQGRL